jgi:hypothetical protein
MSDILAGVVGGSLLAFMFVASPVVLWLKGKRFWATIGWFTGWHVIPTFRLAKPRSWWARRFYDAAKMQRASDRFGFEDRAKSKAERHADARHAEDSARIVALAQMFTDDEDRERRALAVRRES